MSASRFALHTLAASLVVVCSGLLPAFAAELPPGTVISAENIDEIENDTFEGHSIASLLSEKMEWRIRNTGWKLPLANSQEVPLPQEWISASQANDGKTSINKDTCRVDGWSAGEPFPTIDEKDPQAAEKLVWNWHLGQLVGDVSQVPQFVQLLIDGESGIHGAPVGEYTRYKMTGRLTGDNSVEGDGDERGRQLLYFKSPSDMKGMGTYTVMYESEKVPSVWAYIPTVRRVRRLSGGAWMDPVGSSDQLQDDMDMFNARPCWYPEYQLLGKRWILAVANGKTDRWNPNGSDFNEKYPVLENQPPYWNMNNDVFEPREVYVVEATTPSVHPYSKKVMYMDAKYPRIYYVEAYDRKGEFWKFMETHSYLNEAEGDARTTSVAVIDFQRNHATVSLIDVASWRSNFDAKASDFSLQTLQKAGR
ncbi:DUF1329 domain-containing protein [Pseudomonas sp. 5Ae-yellow]|uniref:DUF1329 domain-containing protein n=1 Tax=Pseudomonas sp. 5Ae-yellow TaxID=2759848 RepID=UPI0015F41FA3|nr:DUF1329 domain-containing protein [Pseudomonas sp. 5Ae-yellow]MBA6420975.1 DUF1329 domain-containing protein [Pseudomonas sp. 5Ae-yellow]